MTHGQPPPLESTMGVGQLVLRKIQPFQCVILWVVLYNGEKKNAFEMFSTGTVLLICSCVFCIHN